MKLSLPVLFFLLSCSYACTHSHSESHTPGQSASPVPLPRLNAQISQLKTYAKKGDYSTDWAILVDMGIPETKYRIFMVDLKNDSIVHRGLVAHGHCGNYLNMKPHFSNEPGSNCSSLGYFSIGSKYTGKFGTAYKLHGLDSSNSSAFERFIVLHAHSCIPDHEAVLYLCRSEGCPTVSPKMLRTLEPYLDGSKKPVLLKIFY